MTTPNTPRYKYRKYSLHTYDVWGNSRKGFQVNDTYTSGTFIYIRCKRVVHNQDTLHEFESYPAMNLQLSRAVGGKNLTWDGETEYTLYAENSRNGKPVCELRYVEEVTAQEYKAR